MQSLPKPLSPLINVTNILNHQQRAVARGASFSAHVGLAPKLALFLHAPLRPCFRLGRFPLTPKTGYATRYPVGSINMSSDLTAALSAFTHCSCSVNDTCWGQGTYRQ
ncbi:hypothetical protein V5799_011278 [Amblyomma americanum]|uniref:Uncharacterized protein n=1 Tax=Amblyomma americanum TaxID=6943 RepID=A0AAQ4EHC4_AMBAM